MKKSVLLLLSILLIVGLLCGCGESGSGGSDEGAKTITSISLSASTLTVDIGGTATLEVTAQPADAPVANLTWTSDDTNVATVTDGVVKGVSKGTAVITVKTENGVTKSCSVSVSEVTVKSITLDVTELTVNEGNTFYVTATVNPENVPSDALTWYSSDNKVALVSENGKVTAVSEGTAKISCRASNGVEAVCNLTVKGSSSDEKADDSDSDKDVDDDDSVEKPPRNYLHLERDPGGHLNPDYEPYEADFVFPYSSVEKLTETEIKTTLNNMTGTKISDSYAQDAINEIYARNGYVFKTKSIYEYYASKPWYSEDPDFTINDFNSIEKYNISLLKKYA